MNLQHLFKLQELMESEIVKSSLVSEDSHGARNTKDLRFLALQVKTGELVNLTKCYKYSQISSNIPREKLTVRYIDSMKFLLSIGNMYEFNIINETTLLKLDDHDDIVTIFSNIYSLICKLKNETERDMYIEALSTYIELFSHYLKLGSLLGFEFDEVYKYYQSNFSQQL